MCSIFNRWSSPCSAQRIGQFQQGPARTPDRLRRLALLQGLEDSARAQLGNGLGASPTAHISITKHLGQASPQLRFTHEARVWHLGST